MTQEEDIIYCSQVTAGHHASSTLDTDEAEHIERVDDVSAQRLALTGEEACPGDESVEGEAKRRGQLLM
jgi:hypothetical protein